MFDLTKFFSESFLHKLDVFAVLFFPIVSILLMLFVAAVLLGLVHPAVLNNAANWILDAL